MLLASFLVLVGCSSVSPITLDIVKPAAIMLPQDAHHIVLVDGLGANNYYNRNVYTALDGQRALFEVADDSVRSVAVTTLYDQLTRSTNLDWVTLYTPEEKQHSAITLSNRQVSDICVETGGDVLLHFNNLLIESTLKDTIYDDLYYSVFEMCVKTNLNLYRPDEETPSTYLYADTLFWQGYGYKLEDAQAQLPPAETCFAAAMQYVAERNGERLAPTVVQQDRWIFSESSSAVMREAELYWLHGEYDEASYMWEYAFRTTKRTKVKALAAANLSLYRELQDDYTKALEWAETSLKLFNKESKRSVYAPLVREQIVALKQRIRDNESWKR